jgi:ABC-type multidrug transport system ATPase subunit
LSDRPTNSANDNLQLESAVDLEGVSKLFGRFAALHDLSASLAAGRLYALLGENGAGKTTLLRIIAGLARPTRGSVSVLGRNDPRRVAARIGYMAHASLLYDDLTARENLEYFLGLYPGKGKNSSQDLLAMVGLENVDPRRHVSQYSQGMKQRLALARALLCSPDLLLLDEPFSNVDAKSITAMSLLLGRLRDQGATVIVITHQMEALTGIADEWITMHAGTITQRKKSLLGAGVAPGRGER